MIHPRGYCNTLGALVLWGCRHGGQRMDPLLMIILLAAALFWIQWADQFISNA